LFGQNTSRMLPNKHRQSALLRESCCPLPLESPDNEGLYKKMKRLNVE
jgi:hypothetical protein